VSLLRHFCALTKGAALGFIGGLGGLKRTPRPPGAMELDGAKGFVGVVEGPPLRSAGRCKGGAWTFSSREGSRGWSRLGRKPRRNSRGG
jgi:hypothetical protein